MSYLMDLFKFRLESDASSSYVVLEAGDEEDTQKLQIQMIDQNPNPLILPLSLRVKDHENLIYYNVTSMISLKQFLQKRVLKKGAFIDILLSIAKVLTECKNYYAIDKNFAIDENLIYVNPITAEISMMYIPINFEVNFKKVFKEFLKRIIDNTVQIEEVNDLGFLQNISFYLRDDTFNMHEFQKMLNGFKIGVNIFHKSQPESISSVRVTENNNMNPIIQQKSLKQDIPVPNPAPRNQNVPNPDANKCVKPSVNNPMIPAVAKAQSGNLSTETKMKYPTSSLILGIGLQVVILVLIAVIYAFVVSKQDDKTGPLGGILIISGAVDFLVIRALFDKNKKIAVNVSVKSNSNQVANKSVKNPGYNSVGSNKNINIPGIVKTVNSAVPQVEGKNRPRILNMDKKQTENQKDVKAPVPPAFNTVSPYDLGKTIILTQQKPQSMGLMDKPVQTACLVRAKDGITQKIPVNSSNFVVGRTPESVDYVLDNKKISRLHAAIKYKNGAFYLKDLGSANGTYVNSIRLQNEVECEIKNNDKIIFAEVEFDFIVG